MVADRDGATLIARSPLVAAIVERATQGQVSLDDVWMVGGVVRDAVLGLAGSRDVDLCTTGDVEDLAEALAAACDGEVVAEHRFMTATVCARLDGVDEPVRIDIARARTERYERPGSLPEVKPTTSMSADLRRRDITVNAVAVALAHGHRVLDPEGGIEDMAGRRIRALHAASFDDDPTRVFRAARYAARLAFDVEEATAGWIVAAVRRGAMHTVSRERAAAEIELVLRERAAAHAVSMLGDWGVWEALVPGWVVSPSVVRALADVDVSGRAWTAGLGLVASGLGGSAAEWLRSAALRATDAREARRMLHIVSVADSAARAAEQGRSSELWRSLPPATTAPELRLVAALVRDGGPEGDLDPDRSRRAGLLLDGLARALERVEEFVIRGADVVSGGIDPGPAVGAVRDGLFDRWLDGELPTAEQQRAALAEVVRSGGALGAELEAGEGAI